MSMGGKAEPKRIYFPAQERSHPNERVVTPNRASHRSGKPAVVIRVYEMPGGMNPLAQRKYITEIAEGK
jgi:hypothetical protein